MKVENSSMSDSVNQQSEEYRKGQVLGFTMAEIMLVLLFLLLLLLGGKLNKLNKTIESSYQPNSKEFESIEYIENTLNSLKEKDLIPEEKDVLWLTKKLILQADEIIKKQAAWDKNPQEKIEQLLVENQELLSKNQILREMNEGSHELVEELQKAKMELNKISPLKEILNSNNLSNKEATKCLLSCGGGPKACWGESLANPDFIYNIALYDDGFYVSPELKSIEKNSVDWLNLPKKARLTKPVFMRASIFKQRFGALLEYANNNDCVFQTRLVDVNTSTKKIYKAQRRLVEGYVYPTPFKAWSYGEIKK
jgi:hypothetical protein